MIWSYLIDDPQLAPAFRALRRPTEAFDIFRHFADLGNAAAQNNVGVMFETGWGVDRSDAQAEKYFRLASEHGIPTAQFCLAALLAGDILAAAETEHNTAAASRLAEGYKWALVAKAQHFPDVRLRRFRKRLSLAQSAEAEHLARLWLEQHGVRKQSRLMFLIKNAPLVLTREIWGARRGGGCPNYLGNGIGEGPIDLGNAEARRESAFACSRQREVAAHGLAGRAQPRQRALDAAARLAGNKRVGNSQRGDVRSVSSTQVWSPGILRHRDLR